MKAAGIRYEKRRPPSGGRRRRSRGLVAKARSRVFSIDGCVNDAIGRRTSMSRSGSAYTTSDTISYTYNDRSELTGATSNVDTTYSYSYVYDPIGNRVTAFEAGVPWTYITNNLNQYTSATENNTQLSFAYDLDGNMTYRPVDATSGWTQVWNGENRMVETYKGNVRLTFKYDYMGRRVEKCVYSGNTLTAKTLFVYDGFKCVEELNALNNTALMRHTWQPFDVGLDIILATMDGNGTSYFLHDANKNVMQKTNPVGVVLGMYAYAPFGGNIGLDRAHVGFSSEVMENDAGMVYYNYRYYSNGFWLNTDPLYSDVLDYGNNNLYQFVYNNPISYVDYIGLDKLLGAVKCDYEKGEVILIHKIKEHTKDSDCVYKHEKQHIKNNSKCCKAVRKCLDLYQKIGKIGEASKCYSEYLKWQNETREWDECSALRRELKCLKEYLKSCKNMNCPDCKKYKVAIKDIDIGFSENNCDNPKNKKETECYVDKIIEEEEMRLNIKIKYK